MVLEPEAQISTTNAFLFHPVCSGVCAVFSKNTAMGAKELMIFNKCAVGRPTFTSANLCQTRYRHSPLHISVQYMLRDEQTCGVAVSKLSVTGS